MKVWTERKTTVVGFAPDFEFVTCKNNGATLMKNWPEVVKIGVTLMQEAWSIEELRLVGRLFYPSCRSKIYLHQPQSKKELTSVFSLSTRKWPQVLRPFSHRLQSVHSPPPPPATRSLIHNARAGGLPIRMVFRA